MFSSYQETPSKHTNPLDSKQSLSSRCKSCVSEAPAATLKYALEDDCGECYEIIQRYDCDLDSSTLFTCSLNNANEDLWKRLNDSLIEAGAYALQAGRDRSIKVQIRDDVLSVQMSAIVHGVKFGGMSSTTGRRECVYSLLMTMMRMNSLLCHESCGGRICAFDGQFVFFQDLPISILEDVGRMQRMLDEFILKTVEISRRFDCATREKRERQRRDV